MWKTIEKIREAVGIDRADFAGLLELDSRHYFSLYSNSKDLSAYSIMCLAEKTQVSFESIMTGQIDFEAVGNHFRGHADFVPVKYSKNGTSKRRSVANVLEYIDFFQGRHVTDTVLRRLQVPRAVFSNLDQSINVQFLNDFYQILFDRGYSIRDLQEMGKFSSTVYSRTPLGKALREARTPKRVYEKVFTDLIRQFDESWDYDLDLLTTDLVRVCVTPKSTLKDSFQSHRPGSALNCVVKGAVGGAFTQYLGLTDAECRHTKCIHRGDPECIFEFDLTAPNRQMRRVVALPV